MNEDSYVCEGGCRCGTVRLRMTQKPILTMACHCTGCQRMTSSAFSLSAAAPSDGFAVAQGEPVIGGPHGATRHYFCPLCMSWMFTRSEGMNGFVNVRSTLLGDEKWSTPFIGTRTREKLPWATTPAVRSYGTVPAIEEYEEILSDFQKWAAA